MAQPIIFCVTYSYIERDFGPMGFCNGWGYTGTETKTPTSNLWLVALSYSAWLENSVNVLQEHL